MEKYKHIKFPIHLYTKTIGLILLSLGIFMLCSIPMNTIDNHVTYNYEKKIDEKKILERFSFKGTRLNQINFDNKYITSVYSDNNKSYSHFIDIDNNKEVKFEELIIKDKQADFNKKINELLLLKYPSKVVKELDKAKKEYQFNDNELIIFYETPKGLKTKRQFQLKANYNEIKEFFNFKIENDFKYENESGFDYNPNIVSVAFTFDDGPNDKKTIKLLNALEDYKMTATFFMVANKLENDKETVKKVHDSHSEIGYHSLYHKEFIKQTTEEIQNEFKLSNELLKEITGEEFKIVRPPYGAYNDQVLKALDAPFFRWDLDTNDWRYRDVDYIVNYVKDNYKDGSIILFHDSYDTSIDAAIKLIDYFYMNNIQVMSINDLAKLKNIELKSNQIYYDFKK